MSFEDSLDDDQGQESSVIQQLRAELKEREKREKAQGRELADLQAKWSQVEKERTTKQVEALFSERGLNPSLAHLAVKDRPDAEWDPDGVTEWAATYGLAEPPPPPEPVEEVQQPVSTFVPTPQVGSSQAQRMSYAEFRSGLRSTDPATRRSLMAAYEKGLVDKE